MKIWIDLTNSPHVNFFEYLIKDLQENNEVIITCRSLANTIELLELYNLPFHLIGKHYGRNILKKCCGFLMRVGQLYKFLRKKKIDIAISHSSFYSPVVAKLIGANCIYLNDNEHAAGNHIASIFADRILIPEFVDKKKFQSHWVKLDKILKYPGLKEGIYLWNYKQHVQKRIKSKENRTSKTVYIRPEPLTAQYYKGQQNFLDNLLEDLNSYSFIRTVLLPRNKNQENYYRKNKLQHIYISKKTIPLRHIVENCDLFIGAGGTMTREVAVLGIPTISIYQDKLLDVDRYLIDNGYMLHCKTISAKQVINHLAQSRKKAPSRILLQKGESAYCLIKNLLLNQPKSLYGNFT